MFGIDGGKFLALVVIAVVVVGPERLPGYAEKLAVWVRTLRTFLREAKQRVDEELGDQVGDVDWAALDPRRYDPRLIVREALLDERDGELVGHERARGHDVFDLEAEGGAVLYGRAEEVAGGDMGKPQLLDREIGDSAFAGPGGAKKN